MMSEQLEMEGEKITDPEPPILEQQSDPLIGGEEEEKNFDEPELPVISLPPQVSVEEEEEEKQRISHYDKSESNGDLTVLMEQFSHTRKRYEETAIRAFDRYLETFGDRAYFDHFFGTNDPQAHYFHHLEHVKDALIHPSGRNTEIIENFLAFCFTKQGVPLWNVKKTEKPMTKFLWEAEEVFSKFRMTDLNKLIKLTNIKGGGLFQVKLIRKGKGDRFICINVIHVKTGPNEVSLSRNPANSLGTSSIMKLMEQQCYELARAFKSLSRDEASSIFRNRKGKKLQLLCGKFVVSLPGFAMSGTKTWWLDSKFNIKPLGGTVFVPVRVIYKSFLKHFEELVLPFMDEKERETKLVKVLLGNMGRAKKAKSQQQAGSKQSWESSGMGDYGGTLEMADE